jgi:hypothetical protein
MSFVTKKSSFVGKNVRFEWKNVDEMNIWSSQTKKNDNFFKCFEKNVLLKYSNLGFVGELRCHRPQENWFWLQKNFFCSHCGSSKFPEIRDQITENSI